jgi:asparagine synthetase B (glutamine-hydrolysing)
VTGGPSKIHALFVRSTLERRLSDGRSIDVSWLTKMDPKVPQENTREAAQVERTISAPKHRVGHRFHRDGEDRFEARLCNFDGLKMSAHGLDAWLTLGYVPGDATLFEGVTMLPGGALAESRGGELFILERHRIPRRPLDTSDRPHLLQVCHEAMRQAVSKRFLSGSTHVVPLSGGMDSRLVLGLLAKHTDLSSVETFTFGQPGQADFDIGNRVAKTLGTRHRVLDLRNHQFSASDIIETARRMNGNSPSLLPSAYFPIYSRLAPDAVVWSGFAGDGVGGGFLRALESLGPSTEPATRRFFEWARHDNNWGCDEASLEAVHALVGTDSCFEDVLSDMESVWFCNHVDRYTTHQLFFHDVRYLAPLMDDDLVSTLCSLPRKDRLDKRFFNEAARTACSPIFWDVPTKDYGYKYSKKGRFDSLKSQLGFRFQRDLKKILARSLPSHFHHPRHSYIDLRAALRYRSDVREAVRELFFGFLTRELIDRKLAEGFWDEHQRGGERAREISKVASLEAVLRAHDC